MTTPPAARAATSWAATSWAAASTAAATLTTSTLTTSTSTLPPLTIISPSAGGTHWLITGIAIVCRSPACDQGQHRQAKDHANRQFTVLHHELSFNEIRPFGFAPLLIPRLFFLDIETPFERHHIRQQRHPVTPLGIRGIETGRGFLNAGFHVAGLRDQIFT